MSAFRRVARNFGWLLSGRGGAAALSLAATALAARALGPEAFGWVVLMHTTALLVRHLCSLKAADAVVRFGVPLLQGDAPRGAADPTWRRLVGALYRLDSLAALLAAAVGALLLLFAAAPLGLPPSLVDAAWLYAAALLCCGTGTAKGVLRSLDRYRLLGALLTTAPAVRLAGVGLCMALQAPAAGYLAAWAVGLLAGHLLLQGAVARTLGMLRLGAPVRPALAAHPGLGAFLNVLYWQSNLDQLPRRAAVLAVGGLFGAEGAGIYRLAKDLGEAVDRPVLMLRQAVFPDQNRLWRDDRRQFLALTWRSGLVLAAFGGALFLIAAAFGGALLAALAGEPFRAGALLLALLFAGGVLDLGGAALRPASYAMDQAGRVFRLQIAAALLFFAVLYAAAPAAGLAGAGWATLASAALSLAGMTWLVRRAAAA